MINFIYYLYYAKRMITGVFYISLSHQLLIHINYTKNWGIQKTKSVQVCTLCA